MKIHLSKEEQQGLEVNHRNEKDGRIRDRIKSILLRNEGWSLSKIAQGLRLHNDTVSRYINDYLESKKLSSDHKGSSGKLSDDQNSELIAHLKDNLYTKAVDIVAYIKETYALDYTVAGITDWLDRHGFSFKLTKGQPSKADPVLQEAFIKAYEELKATKSASDPILFIDAVHPTMATKPSRGWILKGIDKIVPTTASRTRLNIVGAIELSTMKVFNESYETVNASSIIEFLNAAKLNYPEASKIHIILDQSGYHRSIQLSEYANKNNINLHFLPPYSPNLNPIERLWKVMNEEVRNNYFFRSAKEFREKIAGFFKNILPDMTKNLKSRINDNFQSLNTAK